MTLLASPALPVDAGTLCLADARLILRDEVVCGALYLRTGRIARIERGSAVPPGAIDCAGDYLLPGLIETHTDNLEKHLMPRAGVVWPALPALLAHDAQMLAAGITTALLALALGDLEQDSLRSTLPLDALAALAQAQAAGLLRAEHHLHLRCELACPQLPQLLETCAGQTALRLVSLMDHTPGQRQYRDVEHYRRYYARRGVSWNQVEFSQLLARRAAQQRRYRARHLAEVCAFARRVGAPLASHDDTETAHIDEACAAGATIAEFPTTLAAAQHAREAGLVIIAGAPNLVRGGSHSGNVAAIELARADCLDVLSSDYQPASLLHGAFLLHTLAGWTLPRAIASVTRTPARMLGFDDRGEIASAQRADLVRVRMIGTQPVVRSVWLRGEQVY